MNRKNHASQLALPALLALSLAGPSAAFAQGAPRASSSSEPPVVAGVPADKATDAQKKEAVELFKAGQLSFSLEKWADALPNFRKSYAVVASPNSHMMVVRSLARLGKSLEAHREATATLAEAQAAVATNPKYASTVQGMKDELVELEKKLAVVVLVLPTGVTDGKLTVNKKPVEPGVWATPIVMDPGKVDVVLTRGDERSKLSLDAPMGARTEAKLPPLRKVATWNTGNSELPPDAPKSSSASARDGASQKLTDAGAAAVELKPDSVSSERPSDRGGFVAGAKVGALASLNGLNPHVTGAVQVGYVLPWLDRSIGLMVDVGYARPVTSDLVGDVRVAAGGYSWHLTRDQLTVQPSLYYRATMLGKIVPYVGAGPRIFLTRSKTDSDEKLPVLLEQREESLEIGVGAHLGAEYLLGPGAVVAEGLFGWAPIQQRTTDEAELTAISAWAGYRFYL
jgi:hypothetical protein